MFVNDHVSAGNITQDLCKSRQVLLTTMLSLQPYSLSVMQCDRTCLGMHTVGWVLQHQSLIKKTPYRPAYRSNTLFTNLKTEAQRDKVLHPRSLGLLSTLRSLPFLISYSRDIYFRTQTIYF